MKSPKLYLSFLFTFLIFSILKAGNPPPQVSQLVNHKDWNFIENKGQLHDDHGTALSDIKYFGHQGGIRMYCRPGKLSFVFTKVEQEENPNISEATGEAAIGFIKDSKIKYSAARADLILTGANMHAGIIASEQQAYFENYKNAYTPDLGINEAHGFKTITYKDIYPHIDMVLHAREGGIKYEFVVNPGGRVSDIQMQWQGLDKLQALADGGISYNAGLGYMQESKPLSYQGDNKVVSTFAQKGHTVAFTVGKYDHSKALVIDPILLWGTYYGAYNDETGRTIVSDAAGNVYVSGESTSSSGGMATTGAFRTTGSAGGTDAFLAKFNAKGVRQWATYYGGNDNDKPLAIVLDGASNILVSGYTASDAGLATSGAYRTIGGGINGYGYDGFLCKFTNNGSFTWATYVGGKGDDYLKAMCIDPSGNVYITGYTYSTTGLATTGAYQSTSGAGSSFASPFIAKYTNNGSLSWATYFGGSSDDAGEAICLDASGNIFISGASYSSGLATSGAYNTSYGGNGDAFLAKFSNSGSLTWATYLGTTNGEDGKALAIDKSGNIILGGVAAGKGIATSGAYQSSGGSGFLAKFSTSGSISWCTYTMPPIGCIALDPIGNIIASGTVSASGIATAGAYQTSYGGNQDGFVAKYSSTGALVYCSYYGGSNIENIWAMTTDGLDNFYFTGVTESTSGIATSGAFQTSHNITNNSTNDDVFIVKFHFGVYDYDAGILSFSNDQSAFCLGTNPVRVKLHNYGNKTLDSVRIGWSVNKKIQTAYKWSGKIKSDSGTTLSIGTYTFSAGIDTIKAWTFKPDGNTDSLADNDTSIIIIKVTSTPLAKLGSITAICMGRVDTLGTTAVAGNTYQWSSNPFFGAYPNTSKIAISPTVPTTYYLTESIGTGGCSKTDSVHITINPLPKPKAGVNKGMCSGASDTLGVPGVSGHTYSWASNPKGYTSNLANPILHPTSSAIYTVTETITATGCSAKDSIFHGVFASAPKALLGNPKLSICVGRIDSLGASPIFGNTYKWSSKPSGFTATVSNPVVKPGVTTTYYFTETEPLHSCSKTDSVTINVNPLPTPDAGKSKAICAGDSANIGAAAASGLTYSWLSIPAGYSNNASGNIIRPKATATYILTETVTATGCSQKDSVTITVNPLPSARWSYTTVSGSQLFVVLDTSVADSACHWSFGDGGTGKGHLISHKYAASGTYKVSLMVTNTNGCSSKLDSNITVKVSSSGIAPMNEELARLSIFPNPFRNITSLQYELGKTSDISIALFDITGKQISSIAQAKQAPGNYSYTIDANKLGLKAGVYMIKFMMDGDVVSKNVVKVE